VQIGLRGLSFLTGTQKRSLTNHAQLIAGLREALSPAYVVNDFEVSAE